MRITAEPLPTTNQLLIRLLGPVVLGSYQLDATPQIREPVSFDVLNGMVRNEEVRLYFTGFATYPEYIKVTLPDATSQLIPVIQVVEDKESFTTVQPLEAITPIEKPVFNEPFAEKIETASPPELPKAWLELSFEHSNPLSVGTYISSSPLTYVGGVAGRAITEAVGQSGRNEAPYLQGIAPRIEGAWTNHLPLSNFDYVEPRSGLFDPAPVGWGIALIEPNDLLRMAITPASPLPSWEITWRPEESSRTTINVQPRLTITTPSVPEACTLQFLVSPNNLNDRGGYLRLTSATGLYTSANFSLEPGMPRAIRFNVQDDPGPVRVFWHQRSGNNTNQVLSLVAPSATTYKSFHTWGPSASESDADVLDVVALTYENRRWPFHQGYIRIDSTVESLSEPISWSIFSTLGATILKVDGGVFSSDFASASLTLADYLASDLSEAGNYKIKWSSEGGFRLIHREALTGISLPFSFDVPIPPPVREAPLRVRIQSYRPDQGSGVIRYFGFLPKA